VQQSGGAELHPELMLPGNAVIISKGTDADRDAYSAFDQTHLADLLQQKGVRRVWIGGLALDVCVQATVLDALKAGFETHLISDASKPIDEMQGQRALENMRRAGAEIAED
jgi:nicotinamidase/pyrazinamidase